jgi:hypothetical protein
MGKPNFIKGKTAWNKGKNNPNAAENGKKGALLQSIKVIGRKRKYNDDGTWSWYYP